MATAYITQYGGTGTNAQIAQGPAIKTETVAIGAEAKSTAFDRNCHVIRLHVDAICSFAIVSPDTSGNYAAATTSSKRIAADQTEYFGVNPGDKISIISNT